MTNHHHGHGSSLLQARHAHLHRHPESESLPPPPPTQQQHNHQPGQPQPDDLRHRSPNPDSDGHLHIRSHEAPVVRQAADLESADFVTEVVETVSVVHIVDADGSLIQIKTNYTPPPGPLTKALNTLTKGLAEPTLDLPLPVPTPTQPASQDETSSPALEAGTPTPTPEPTPEPTSQPAESLTSTPLTTSSSASISAAALNSTHTPLFKNATVPYGNFSIAGASATLSESSITLIDETTISVTPLATGLPGTTTPIAAPAPSVDAAPVPPPAEAPAPAPATGPPTSTVVGSVVGSIAGVAIILVAALFLLRWRRSRQHNGHHMLSDPFEGAATRSLPFRDDGGGGNGSAAASGAGNRAMAERGLPFANPSTLAALTGLKRSSQKGQQQSSPTSPRSRGFHQAPPPSPGAESTTERGFYRVSGRKLPSVLQHGGDGYTDPRESHMSGGGSSVYSDASRDYLSSIGNIGTGGKPAPQRFALGSPMRPDSGFPVVMQPGAVRTPVVERGPPMVFTPGGGPGTSSSNSNRSRDDLAPPPSSLDPIGRSHVSQDGSRGSGSRFTEAI